MYKDRISSRSLASKIQAIVLTTTVAFTIVFGTYLPMTNAQLQQPELTPQGQQQSTGADTNGGIPILSSSIIRTDHGSIYIVGEVRNDLSNTVEYVQIVGRLYDSEGLLIDTDFGYTYLDQLRPGEMSPFKLIIMDEAVAEDLETYDLSITWDEIPSRIEDKSAALRLEQGAERINQHGWYTMVGEVVNSGSTDTEFVKVIATLYDDAGTVIDVDFTYTNPSDIAAGQSAPFEMTIIDEEIAEEIESVKLTTQSNEYFMIDPKLGIQQQQQQQPSLQPQPQQEQEGSEITTNTNTTITITTTAATTFESIADGFRIGVPSGWIIQDLNNTEPNMQIAEEELGFGLLAILCPQERAIPVIDANHSNDNDNNNQECEFSNDSVYVQRVRNLSESSTFANLPNGSNNNNNNNNDSQTNNVTVSDFLVFTQNELLEGAGYSNFQLINETDTTINFTNPQTNQTIATIPAKLVEYTYVDNETIPLESIEIRTFSLIAVNENTGYDVLHEQEASLMRSGSLPGQIQQIFDSFELIAMNDTGTNNTTAATTFTTPSSSSSPIVEEEEETEDEPGSSFVESQQETAATTPPPSSMTELQRGDEEEEQQQSQRLEEDESSDRSEISREEEQEEEEESDCHPSYPDFCIPPPPPNLNCGDIPERRFTVLSPDPHGFDRDNDGIGCES